MLHATQFSVGGRAWIAALVLAMSLPWTIGCGGEDGPPRAAIHGAVSLDAKPLSEGIIRFIPAAQTKGPAAAAIVKDGKYALPVEEGPVIGNHRVEIEAIGHYGFAIDDEAAFAQRVEKQGGRLAANPVPEIYNRRSALTAEISAEGDHELNFNLSSQGGHTTQR